MAQFLLNWLICVSSVAISALTAHIALAFDVPLYEVNLAVSCSAAIFLPAFILSIQLYNKLHNVKTVLSISAVLMLIGAWVRMLSKISGQFWWIVIGQSIIAIAGPFLISAISIISNLWFADNERATATSLMSLSNPLGSFCSFLI
jgi:predicted MFS family arabinose efflux permease